MRPPALGTQSEPRLPATRKHRCCRLSCCPLVRLAGRGHRRPPGTLKTPRVAGSADRHRNFRTKFSGALQVVELPRENDLLPSPVWFISPAYRIDPKSRDHRHSSLYVRVTSLLATQSTHRGRKDVPLYLGKRSVVRERRLMHSGQN